MGTAYSFPGSSNSRAKRTNLFYRLSQQFHKLFYIGTNVVPAGRDPRSLNLCLGVRDDVAHAFARVDRDGSVSQLAGRDRRPRLDFFRRPADELLDNQAFNVHFSTR